MKRIGLFVLMLGFNSMLFSCEDWEDTLDDDGWLHVETQKATEETTEVEQLSLNEAIATEEETATTR